MTARTIALFSHVCENVRQQRNMTSDLTLMTLGGCGLWEFLHEDSERVVKPALLVRPKAVDLSVSFDLTWLKTRLSC